MLRRLLKNRRGFTLIELMIVVTIIGILASIAVPNYKWGLIRAREAVLRENLYNLRNTIDQFFADQGKYPDALQDIVDKKYMRELPRDPFTGKNDSWVTVPPPEPTAGSSGPGTKDMGKVFDVHSGSDLVGNDGRPYNEW
ncbi:type IV pilin protein [Geobacter pickeringii]|uniref:General secretion pathway protein GspG n=1 Tax=Geobacter pickeringii TaxID=345632 RepID=A0A0B5B8Y1_9BACT|nr:prepilin-type N-terminal cleavage/methylation domain-containing protein [Geobacter pickeringii]AJE03173.1 general secretion pathway protein GspG [Geobacter pickeringii]